MPGVTRLALPLIIWHGLGRAKIAFRIRHGVSVLAAVCLRERRVHGEFDVFFSSS